MNDKAVFQHSNVPRTRFAGHSLIEILVVLIIVGVLIAIMVPAVQRARESARMAQCIHNQGQLAKAVHMHLADEPYGRFPGYRAFAADGSTVIGWAPQVFEYLGRSDLPEDPTQATFVEVLVCPSDQGPTDSARLNYVVNGGQPDTDSPADGIFFDHAKPDRVYITKDDFRDGLTNTILLAENLDATAWNDTDEAAQCILWPLINGNEVNNGTGARPSSHHPGGFVAAFADGSVKFMNEVDLNEDPAVHSDGSLYTALLTPGGDDAPPEVIPETYPDDWPTDDVCVAGSAGPILHINFDDPSDPGRDISGNGHDGEVFGNPTFESTLDGGRVMVFDGLNDKVVVDYSPDFNSPCMTITAWIRVPAGRNYPSSENGHGAVLTNRNVVNNWFGTGYVLYVTPDGTWAEGSNTVSWWTGLNANIFPWWHRIYAWQVESDQWEHVAAILRVLREDADGTRWVHKALYRNGSYHSDTTDQDIRYNVNTSHDLQIGVSTAGNAALDQFWYTGAIDDVRIYDRELAPSEITAVMNEWPGQ